MRHTLVIILFSLVSTYANAENLFDVSWNFGNAGVGINYSSDNDDSIELTVSIFNLIIEQENVNIGFEFNPIKYWALYYFQNELEQKNEGEKISFINSNLYWDLARNKNILFGPFISINYFFLDTLAGINLNEYIFTGGLRFSYKMNGYIFNMSHNNYQILSSEIGYRIIVGKHKFYFSVNIDILLALYSVGIVMTNDYKAGY